LPRSLKTLSETVIDPLLTNINNLTGRITVLETSSNLLTVTLQQRNNDIAELLNQISLCPKGTIRNCA